MISVLTLWALVQLPDTVSMSAGEALRRALEANPVVEAAHGRALAAESRVRQARTLGNPTLSATAENLGAAVQTTGLRAWEGVEGQLLLGGRIPLGGDRGATVRSAEASASEASAREGAAVLDVGVETVETIARLVHDRALARHAMTDAEGVQELADAVERQAALGRAPEGDAARLRLASASAWVRVASAQALEIRSASDLKRLLVLGPDTPVSVRLPVCEWDDTGSLMPDRPAATSTLESGSGATSAAPRSALPDLAVLDARIRGWEAAQSLAGAQAVPDLVPQVGWRRSGGFDALYVGLQVELPFFDRRQGARQAARLESEAAVDERAALAAWFDASRSAARHALEVLDLAGDRFDEEWVRALARTVESAEARYVLGEGTLTEVLDSRRARLDALSDFEGWRQELFESRARLTRHSGAPITDEILCDPSPDMEASR